MVQLVDLLRYKPEGRGFYSRLLPAGRNIALGSIQPLTEVSAGYISWKVKAAGA